MTTPAPQLPPVLKDLKEHEVYNDTKHHIRLYQGDCLEILAAIPESSVDLIFADPPYFLSNGGITCHAGRMVSVNKGTWDKSKGPEINHEFNRSWLAACQRVLKPNGSIWVSGTAHVIHSVGFASNSDSNSSTTFPGSSPIRLPISPAAISLTHRNHNLGRPRQKIPPHLQLQAHEADQRRQTK
jgi:DNA methylase